MELFCFGLVTMPSKARNQKRNQRKAARQHGPPQDSFLCRYACIFHLHTYRAASRARMHLFLESVLVLDMDLICVAAALRGACLVSSRMQHAENSYCLLCALRSFSTEQCAPSNRMIHCLDFVLTPTKSANCKAQRTPTDRFAGKHAIRHLCYCNKC